MNIIDDEGPRSTIDGIVCISDTKDLVPSCSCQSRLDIRSADKVLRLHCSLQRSTNLLDVAENLPNGRLLLSAAKRTLYSENSAVRMSTDPSASV